MADAMLQFEVALETQDERRLGLPRRHLEDLLRRLESEALDLDPDRS